MRSNRVYRAALLGLSVFLLPAMAVAAPWRHAIIQPKSDAGFATMIDKGGFAKKQGLDLEIVQFQSDALAEKALLAGAIESYEAAPNSAIVAASRGADSKIIGCHWLSLVHAVFVSSKIKKPQDMEGKSFAISQANAMPDVLGRAWLTQNKVPEATVRFASLGADLDRYKTLIAGVADASVISIEFTPLAEKAGLRVAAKGRDLLPDFLRLCTVSTGKVLAARHADAVLFMAAEMQALQYALTHRDAELALTREVSGATADDPRPEYIYDDAVAHHTIDPTMPIPVAKLTWLQNLLIKTGNIAQPFDSEKMVDGSIRAAALKKIGTP